MLQFYEDQKKRNISMFQNKLCDDFFYTIVRENSQRKYTKIKENAEYEKKLRLIKKEINITNHDILIKRSRTELTKNVNIVTYLLIIFFALIDHFAPLF